MRLLLILALLAASVAMAFPAQADAGVPAADCHAAMADHGSPADSKDHPRTLGHSCPGCAAFAPALPMPTPRLTPAKPGLAKMAVWQPSIATAPIPPPPQIA